MRSNQRCRGVVTHMKNTSHILKGREGQKRNRVKEDRQSEKREEKEGEKNQSGLVFRSIRRARNRSRPEEGEFHLNRTKKKRQIKKTWTRRKEKKNRPRSRSRRPWGGNSPFHLYKQGWASRENERHHKGECLGKKSQTKRGKQAAGRFGEKEGTHNIRQMPVRG